MEDKKADGALQDLRLASLPPSSISQSQLLVPQYYYRSLAFFFTFQ
jgi:hypothetical protein